MARYINAKRGMRISLSGGLATMGSAVPYAIAAKFAFPDRVVIALAGDGAMQMNGLAELLTVQRYWKKWSDPRLIVLVLNNADLSQVTWELRVMGGSPKFPATQDLPEFSYAGFAESIGFKGLRVDSPERVGDAWDEALSSDRPVVLDAIISSDVATLPPHITMEEAKHFLQAARKGDPSEKGMIVQSIKQMIAGVVPHQNK